MLFIEFHVSSIDFIGFLMISKEFLHISIDFIGFLMIFIDFHDFSRRRPGHDAAARVSARRFRVLTFSIGYQGYPV